MSKTVRIKEHLAAEVERLAKEDRRSLANMVEILLEQALRMDEEPITKRTVKTEPSYVETQTTTTPKTERRSEAIGQSAVDPFTHDVKTDFKK